MSLVEVSKSIGELAKAFHEKSVELDRLKALYSSKLELLNSYVACLPGENKETISDESLLDHIKSPVCCQNCNALVWDSSSEFLLLPKRLIRVPGVESDMALTQLSNSLDHTSIKDDNEENETHHGNENENHNYNHESEISVDKAKKSYHGKSKKVCSYCKKTGHSRARCFVRLNGQA
ncbi:hypothetical protein CANTEDRAFT_116722 [Yamadazyma tenuis ATCC 10573]|uniref:Uncharacterized protein n=1 Tax=Candida tenuis (strain ATCC 10573 / BCRC 21748 / CBS 615 / JCM 9827 / NBRC 10315 / NRRL Y-1498 / VKM Y-70) TaxID=590646 RepID=G3BFE3_CANTC|nr:uncharacterized protein CANTEDRAFT_116722 [Yamadazyma tenuis ATCC 10573]EGV60666.1 hypothetical protein CANTEDRAFT_116722 [Yamadazyma tenuis ATCC 10573]